MSRWISSVNKLLDNLDTNVGDVVENQQAELFDSATSGGVGGESSVDDILAKRGLLNDIEDDDDDDDDDADEEAKDENEEEDDNDDDEEDSASVDGIDNDDEDGNDDGDDVEQQDEEGSIGINIDIQGEDNDTVEMMEDQNDNESDGDVGGDGQNEEVVFHDAAENNDETIMDAIGSNSSSNSNSGANENNNVDVNVENIVETEKIGNEMEVQTSTSRDSQEEKDKQKSSATPKASAAPKISSNQNQKQLQQQQQQKQKEMEKMITQLKKQLKEQKQHTATAKKEASISNKETRKLRRTVVKLNAELDSAERELDAQRTELERAAVRMDKERLRYKEDKERLEYGHKEDMKAVMEEHKSSIDTMVSSHAEQMVDMEERIKRAEEARAKEGGDMSQELAEAAGRERDTLKKVIGLEEEKATLMSQIASLNTQMSALQSRVESLQEAADAATEHEREADDRLDAALSLHARQISQRQAREAELERTVADIAAALVVARQREAQVTSGVGVSVGVNAMNSKHSGEPDGDNLVELKEKLEAAEDEIEVFKAQLMLERQKSETLQKELEGINQERTQELSSSLARQKQHDRRVLDLTSTVTQLQSKLRSLKHPVDGTINDGDDDSEDNIAFAHFQAKENEYKKQISSLSEDLLRQRGRLENTSTEVLTLRNRLRAALNRAEAAEKEARASAAAAVDHTAYDIERGPPIGSNSYNYSYSNKTRRRFGARTKKAATIRSVLKLDSGSSEAREAIGGTIDSMDLFTVKMLNVLRSDPFARIFLIVYLVVLHLWTFFLLAFHAHGTLEPSANVGPEQLLKHSYRHMEQVHASSSTP